MQTAVPSQLSKEQIALIFVNRLVPGSFDEARQMVDPSCGYTFGDKTFLGAEVVLPFEESHAEAKRKFDIVEYLPAWIVETEGNVVLVGVSDRIELAQCSHTYSDRLAITVDPHRITPILRIEHCPIPEERAQLAVFIAAQNSK
jgi:hypothetical protein